MIVFLFEEVRLCCFGYFVGIMEMYIYDGVLQVIIYVCEGFVVEDISVVDYDINVVEFINSGFDDGIIVFSGCFDIDSFVFYFFDFIDYSVGVYEVVNDYGSFIFGEGKVVCVVNIGIVIGDKSDFVSEVEGFVLFIGVYFYRFFKQSYEVVRIVGVLRVGEVDNFVLFFEDGVRSVGGVGFQEKIFGMFLVQFGYVFSIDFEDVISFVGVVFVDQDGDKRDDLVGFEEFKYIWGYDVGGYLVSGCCLLVGVIKVVVG